MKQTLLGRSDRYYQQRQRSCIYIVRPKTIEQAYQVIQEYIPSSFSRKTKRPFPD